MTGFYTTLITWGLVIIGSALIVSPFLIVKLKFRPLLWRHIAGAYAVTIGLWLLLEALLYNISLPFSLGLVQIDQVILQSATLLIIIFQLFLLLSPFAVVIIKYRSFTLKRFLIAMVGSALFFLFDYGIFIIISLLAFISINQVFN